VGRAGRGRERASKAPAKLVEGRRGAAPDVPVLQSARALPMQPASKRSEQIESAWPFANFAGGMGGRLRQGGDGGIERRSRLRTPSEAAAHEILMTGSERFALQTFGSVTPTCN
jgi:hypothetical protein